MGVAHAVAAALACRVWLAGLHSFLAFVTCSSFLPHHKLSTAQKAIVLFVLLHQIQHVRMQKPPHCCLLYTYGRTYSLTSPQPSRNHYTHYFNAPRSQDVSVPRHRAELSGKTPQDQETGPEAAMHRHPLWT